MKKIKLNEKTPDHFRRSLIRFIIKYGDGHITKRAISWLKRSPFSTIDQENGDLVHVFLNDKNRMIAVLAIGHFGLEQAIIVVHPRARKTGVANRLVIEALKAIDRFYVKVANDNVPSLKLCFSVGMRAFDLIKGPTGKPTFVLGIGDWDANEWKHYHK